MKRKLVLSSATLTALLLAGAAPVAMAETVTQTQFDTKASISFSEGTDAPNTTNPENPDPTQPGPPGVQGSFAVDYASDLNFGSHKISTQEENYYASADTTAFKGGPVAPFVEMHDTRGNGAGKGNWKLTVTQKEQFKQADSGTQLEGAALTFSQAHTENAQGTGYKPTGDASYTLVPGTAQTVMTGDGTAGQFLTSYGKAGDYKGNETDAPISLNVPQVTAKGSYSSTLQWDLIAD